jgi:hypothetical protein
LVGLSTAIIAALPWIDKLPGSTDNLTESFAGLGARQVALIGTGQKLEDVLAREQARTKQVEGDTNKVKDAIKTLRNAYGDLGNAIKSKSDLARYASEQASNALDRELDQARESYNTNMGFLSSLYAEKIKLLNAGASEAISAIQAQIDAIDKQTETEDRSLQDQRDEERKTELQRALHTALSKGTAEDAARAKKDLSDFIAEVERRHLIQNRQDEKDALRDSIENIRTDTKAKEDALNAELRKAEDTQRDILSATERRIKDSKALLDGALDKELTRLATELKEKEDTEIGKLGATNNRLASEEQSQRDSYGRQLEDTKKYIGDLNALFQGVIFPSGGSPSGGGAPVQPTNPSPNYPPPPYGPNLPGYANGGIVTQPTLAMIGESGPEAIVPLSGGSMGGLTINFTQPVFFDREDTMNRFVDMIRKGIQRQDRLRFGGAYGGT